MQSAFERILSVVLEDLGHPSSLLQVLAAYPQLRVSLDEVPRCIDAGSIPRWDELGTYPPLDWPRRSRGTLSGWRMTGGQWQSFEIKRSEYMNLGRCTTVEEWTCDVSEVAGFSSSKADLRAFETTDAMIELRWPELIAEVTPEAMSKNLAHDEIRIIHARGTGDCFVRYQWDWRVWLSNSGGSHHLAAAKYIATRLGLRVPLAGKLYVHSLNPQAIAELRGSYDIFVVNDDDAQSTNAFFDAMHAFKATWLWHAMPRPFHRTRAVLLPKCERRSRRVAQKLRHAGFVDLGQHLANLAAKQGPGVA